VEVFFGAVQRLHADVTRHPLPICCLRYEPGARRRDVMERDAIVIVDGHDGDRVHWRSAKAWSLCSAAKNEKRYRRYQGDVELLKFVWEGREKIHHPEEDGPPVVGNIPDHR